MYIKGYVLGSFRGETRGNAVPIFEVLKNSLWAALRTTFRQKHAPDCKILHIQSQKFSGVLPQNPCSRGGASLMHRSPARLKAWTLTQISAGLASVPIVPVLQNDYWYVLA